MLLLLLLVLQLLLKLMLELVQLLLVLQLLLLLQLYMLELVQLLLQVLRLLRTPMEQQERGTERYRPVRALVRARSLCLCTRDVFMKLHCSVLRPKSEA